MKFKKFHPWDLNPRQAIRIQYKLKRKIKSQKYSKIPRLIAAADVAFRQGKAFGAVVILSFPELKLIECVRKVTKISYPYIPGLLTFREGPVLEKCFRALKNEPDITIFDGQGMAHPRNMGIATHMGILLDKPTIGCAKTRLFGEYTPPQKNRGAFSYLLDQRKNKLGVVLRTRDFVQPVYVSPGYKIDIDNSIRIVLSCAQKYRLPKPLRLAHQLTQQVK
jgi:deoxyribonuclease V